MPRSSPPDPPPAGNRPPPASRTVSVFHPTLCCKAVAHAAREWNTNRHSVSINNTADVRVRLEHATNATPSERWAQLAQALDPRLLNERDWPVTAAMLQQVHDNGHDVAVLARQLVSDDCLGDLPAQDLRYRLVSYLPENASYDRPPSHDKTGLSGSEHERRKPPTTTRQPDLGPRR